MTISREVCDQDWLNRAQRVKLHDNKIFSMYELEETDDDRLRELGFRGNTITLIRKKVAYFKKLEQQRQYKLAKKKAAEKKSSVKKGHENVPQIESTKDDFFPAAPKSQITITIEGPSASGKSDIRWAIRDLLARTGPHKSDIKIIEKRTEEGDDDEE